MEELVDKGKSLSTDFVKQFCCNGLPLFAGKSAMLVVVVPSVGENGCVGGVVL